MLEITNLSNQIFGNADILSSIIKNIDNVSDLLNLRATNTTAKNEIDRMLNNRDNELPKINEYLDNNVNKTKCTEENLINLIYFKPDENEFYTKYKDCILRICRSEDYVSSALTNLLTLSLNLENINDYSEIYHTLKKINFYGIEYKGYEGYTDDDEFLKDYNEIILPNLKNFRYIFLKTASLRINDFLKNIEKVKIIKIWCCSDLTNVESLKNADFVTIFGCENLKDVTELKNVKKLFLIRNDGITDVTVTEQCEYLELSTLRNFSKLHVHGKLNSLFIDNCSKLTSIENFDNIKKLKIDNCYRVTDISNIQNIEKLTILRCANLTKISNIKNIEKMIIEDCRKLVDVFTIENVRNLTIVRAAIYDVSNLNNIPRVNLIECLNIQDVNMLTGVEHLDLSFCLNVKSVFKLRNIKSICARRCDKIKHKPLKNYVCCAEGVCSSCKK